MTITIPVIFERGVFKPLVQVPLKTHCRFTLTLEFDNSERFSQQELAKLEQLFKEPEERNFRSAKTSLAFHRKLCRL